ncbi:MAG TPA: C39 family peptidase [Patescibacteria group bacterium]|nr:C39 family peptidase [Patescibacteria group bacterium]
MNRNEKKFFLFSIFLAIFLGRASFILADDCDNIPSDKDNITKKIECLTTKVSELSSQAKTLKNQVAQFDAQIKLTTLKIADTESKIQLLGGRIDQLEVSLNDLSAAFASRAVETYKLSKFENGFFFILSATDVNDAVSRFHYLQKIQEEDRSLLGRLQETQTTYQGQKTDQETLQSQLKTQQANLTAQKTAKNNLLKATQNDESKYQAFLSQARAQLAAFRSFVTSKGGASILSNQTRSSSWGYYYNQRDSEWGNMGIGSSGVSMADAGCLVTSVAMVATHYGKNIKPSGIAGSTDPFVPSTAYMYQSWSSLGISVTRTPVSASESAIDGEINAGRPVIVGLYGSFSYPQHFIVIKGKDGGGYIMLDPFLKDGGDGVKHLSDGGYNFNNIVRVDKIKVN